jgi:WD40 repeat protein
MPDTPPTPNSDPQIQQDVKGNQNQTIGQVLGGMVVYGQVIYNNPAVENDSTASKPEAVAIGPNPYKGLLAFHETDGDRFFGRDPQIKGKDGLWEKFRTLHEDESATRLLTIYGPSGSGKSSLARAGLIPELAREPLPGRDRARVAVMVPGSHPLEALATVLARIATGDATPVAKTREFAAELKEVNSEGIYDGLRRIGEALPEIADKPLIVLVDQFEEVFTLCEDLAERDAFIENLLCASGDHSKRMSALVTLRSDFLGATQKYSRLNQLIASQGYLVAAMSAEGLREAITKPAEDAKHPLDSSTVDRLIEQTEGREGALPLLQFALTQIWDGLVEGKEPTETLRAIGGVSGALTQYADENYGRLSSEKQDRVRRIFVQLVRPGEGIADTRRLATKAEVGEENWALVQELANKRLVVTSGIEGTETETVEVIHEALIYNWEKLRDWIKKDWVFRAWQERLRGVMSQWQNTQKDEGSLLRGVALAEAEDWLQNRSNELTAELEFITASVDLRDREKEKLFRQRKRTIVGLTSGLVGALGLAAIAGVGWGVATKAATNDRIKALVSESSSFLALSSSKEHRHTERDFTLPKNSKSLEQLEKSQKDTETQQFLLQKALLNAIQAGLEVQHGIGVEEGTRSQVLEALRQVISTQEKPSEFTTPSELRAFRQVIGTQGNLPEFTLAECDQMKRGPVSLTWTSDRNTIACVNYDGTVRLWDGKTGQKINVFRGDSEWVDDVKFSPDRKMLASGTMDGTVRIWERSTGKEIRALKGHLSQVNTISFSPDGKTVVAGNYDGTIIFWDMATGKELRILEGLVDGKNLKVNRIFFSPNGQLLAAQGEDNTLRIWKVTTGIELGNFHLEDRSSIVSFSPNSQNLIYSTGSLSPNQTVRFWSIREKRELKNIDISGKPFLSPDGKIIAVIDAKDSDLFSKDKLSYNFAKGTVSLWNVSTGKKVKTLSNLPPGELSEIRFSRDSSLIAIDVYDNKGGSNLGPAVGSKYKVSFWKRNGERLKTVEQLGEIMDIEFSPDSRKVAISSFGQRQVDYLLVKLWDVTTGQTLKSLIDEPVLFTPRGYLVGLESQFSPDGKMVAVVNASGIVKFFDPSTGAELNSPNVSPAHDIGQRTSANDKGVLTLRTDGSLRFRDRSTGQETRINRNESTLASASHISADNKTITTVNWYGKLLQRELSTGRILSAINLPFDKSASSVKFSPDGQKVAAARSNYTIKIWDANTGKEVTTFEEHEKIVDKVNGWRSNEVFFSPNGQMIAIFRKGDPFNNNKGGKLELWEVSTGKVFQFSKLPSDIKNISFSPNSNELAALKNDNTIQLWDLSTQQLLKTIKPNFESADYIQFSHDSKLIFVQGLEKGKFNHILKLVSTETNQEINSFKIPSGLFEPFVELSPDSKTLILQSGNKFTFLNLDLDNLLRRSCNLAREYFPRNPESVNEHDKHICDSIL